MSCFKCLLPEKIRLKLLTKKKYPFPFKEYYVYVEEVVDGDTYHITFLCHGSPLTMKLRLSGIDTPEIHSKNEKEKKAAVLVSKYVKMHIEKRYFKCIINKWDKYGGRVVGHLITEDGLFSKHMLNMGLCKEYEGNKKEEWKEQELDKIIRKFGVG